MNPEFVEALKDADRALSEAHDFMDEAYAIHTQDHKYDAIASRLTSILADLEDALEWIRNR